MRILREWITAVPTEEQEKHFFSNLASRYVPVFHSGINILLQLLHVPGAHEIIQPSSGEVFVSNGGGDLKLFYYLKFSSGTEVGSLSETDIQGEHNAFVQSVASSLGEGATRRKLQPPNKVFAALSQEWGNLSISDEDRTSAALLLDPAVQRFLREVVRTGRVPLGEAGEGLPRPAVAGLERAGMLKSQFSIFCRQTGNQIMMVDSTDAIEEATKQGFKCFVCGRSFSEERLTQFVSPTPYGQKISKPNYWLVIQACNLLSEVLPPERISAIYEGEVATLFLNVESSLVLVEIKETPYHLKDAYLLARKVELYKPAASFLLLATPAPQEALRFLSSGLEGNPHWIGESLEQLKERIPDLIRCAYKSYLRDIFDRFTEFSSIPVQSYLLPYLFPKEGLVVEKVERVEREEIPPPLPVMEEEPKAQPELPPVPQAKEEPAEILPSEILEFESHAAVATRPGKKEIVRRILEELEGGVAGRESSLHILLQDLGDADRRCKACLISQDGLVVASTLAEEVGEILASYGSECFTLVQNLIREHGLTPLNTLAMASPNFSVELYPVAGFYLVVATTLETVVEEPLPDISFPEALKVVCDRLLSRRGLRSIGLVTQDGLMLCEAGSEAGQSSPLFPVFLELFPKMAAYFGPMGQGDLEGMAVRTPAHNIALVRSGAGFIAVTFDGEESYEDFAPHLLSLASSSASLFSPAEV